MGEIIDFQSDSSFASFGSPLKKKSSVISGMKEVEEYIECAKKTTLRREDFWKLYSEKFPPVSSEYRKLFFFDYCKWVHRNVI